MYKASQASGGAQQPPFEGGTPENGGGASHEEGEVKDVDFEEVK
jgi:hypothetical protein